MQIILELRASAQIHFSCISQFRIYTWTRGWWCFRTCCTSLAGSLLPTKPFDVIRCLLWHFLTKQTDVCDIKSKVIHLYFWIVQRALHSSSLFSILRIMLLSELLTLLLFTRLDSHLSFACSAPDLAEPRGPKSGVMRRNLKQMTGDA